MKNITEEQLKTCNDCGKKKTLDQYTERKNHRGTGVQYLTPYCKECMVKRAVKWRKKNKDRYNAYQNEYAKAKAKEGKGSI